MYTYFFFNEGSDIAWPKCDWKINRNIWDKIIRKNTTQKSKANDGGPL